jgi:hypothetical protein
MGKINGKLAANDFLDLTAPSSTPCHPEVARALLRAWGDGPDAVAIVEYVLADTILAAAKDRGDATTAGAAGSEGGSHDHSPTFRRERGLPLQRPLFTVPRITFGRCVSPKRFLQFSASTG